MKINNYALIIGLLLFLAACSKDRGYLPKPTLSETNQDLAITVNTLKSFAADAPATMNLSHQWELDGKIVSTGSTFDFKPIIAGNYTLVYSGTTTAGTFVFTYKITVPVPVVVAGPTSSKYISKVFDYLPGPGQFINEALGSPAGAQKLVGATSNLVTLGGFGGYVIFGFDHSVNNQSGYDLGIYGNPIGGNTPFAEPGIVMVSQDKNGNGKPDDEWFELAGSEYNDPTTIKNYEITYKNPKGYANVTWTDNQGNSGSYDINNFHRHNYYPEFAPNQESITFKGTKLRSSWGKVGSIFINAPFNFGYSDSASAGDNYVTNRYNGFDLDWAVNNAGQKVSLKTIDFVKVYTGQVEKGNTLLGEISTEILGAIDLNIK